MMAAWACLWIDRVCLLGPGQTDRRDFLVEGQRGLERQLASDLTVVQMERMIAVHRTPVLPWAVLQMELVFLAVTCFRVFLRLEVFGRLPKYLVAGFDWRCFGRSWLEVMGFTRVLYDEKRWSANF